MKLPWRGKRRWIRKLFCGAALGLGLEHGPLYAQMLPDRIVPYEVAPASAAVSVLEPGVATGWFASPAKAIDGDPCAPAWCDPISRVPNMFGGFFATGLQGSNTTTSPAVPLHYTGVGGEGAVFTGTIAAPITVTGPKGPFTLSKDISIPPLTKTYTLSQNGELTGLVDAKSPGAKFVTGGGTENLFGTNFFYDYLVPGSHNVQSIALPDPAGGGLAGRNLYFENGSTLPQDRVYFFYNYVGSFQLPGYSALDINRFVFGFEKTFFDGRLSIEVRIPFAGTLDRDQTLGQGLAVDNPQFGDVGLALKALLYRTPNFAASVGLGISLPTAGDSRMYVGGTPVLDVENRTCILQPLLGLAWAPNDRFYAQSGLQFDFETSRNPVDGLNANGGLSRIGVLNDQNYAFLNTAAGYWIYNGTGWVTGVALQAELDYYASLGTPDPVQAGNLSLTNLSSHIDVLNFTPGVIVEFSKRAHLSLGVSIPVAGDRLYNWALTAQLNYNF